MASPSNPAASHTLHATEEDARIAFDKPFLGRDRKRSIEIAVNGETWSRNGKWQRIAFKKRPTRSRSLNRVEGLSACQQ